jgi:glycosyltransferase involved in cell wall biosynthesis
MRLLHVVPSYLPAVRYGGPVFAVHALCAALTKRGCEVTVFTTNVDGPGESAVPLGAPVSMDGVNVRYFRSPWLRRLYYSPAMARALHEQCGNFDAVHLHSVFLWPTWAAARAASRAGVPYLLSPRGMLVKDLIARKSSLPKRAWIALIERRNIEQAAGIHVTSRVEALELQRFGFALPSLHEVPNGVDRDAQGTEESIGAGDALGAEAEALLDSGRPVILALGRINWKKGLDRLIPAVARLPAAVLLVVGNDEEGHTAALRELARREGVVERVMFAGPVFGRAKAALYRRAAVVALASYSENFGNVVLEAMAEGCPVVVTPEVGAAPIVEELGGGLVVQGSPVAIAEGLQKLLGDPALRAAMGRRASGMVMAKYSWNAAAVRMIEVYETIAGKGVS